MKRKLPSLHRLSPYFTVIVFCFAGVVIYLQLRAHSLSEIASDIRSIPSTKVLSALALVVPGLLALACYAVVAAKYLKLSNDVSSILCPKQVPARHLSGAYSQPVYVDNIITMDSAGEDASMRDA